jgi:serine/threonine protein kinase/Flp pilus assembly protein TadD
MTAQPDDQTRTHIILTQGTMVQHYRIIEKIGAGGMGEVYLAEDTKLNRRVALKFLPAHLADDADVRARFTREAQAAAKLDHPNIITIHEVSEFNDRPFFAMQYIDGKTLHQYCQEDSLPIVKIVHLVSRISDGLAKAHAAGVTHRDIKAANIIVDKDLRPIILDFGLATVQGGEMLTKAGSTLGTVAYMSPEQAQGRETDSRSDLFSLGIVLYELIAGKTPFKRNSDAATLHAIVSESPEPLARYKADSPAELQRVISKALAKNPAERYQSAADLAADLGVVERSLTTGDRTSSSRIAVSRPSIAVLPFTNMSADPENEYFSDGLTEELLNVLAKNPELKVTGRTSSFAFKGKQEDLRGIGQKLGVETLLEGSVRKSGSRVRITAQLVSVADGFHLWSETYDRVLDDIFAVQDDIAKAVSTAMHVTLVGLVDEGTKVNPESYALVLRAHQSALQMTRESLAAAVELYQKAIALDAKNARAWAGLSYALGHRIAYGHSNHQDEYPKAREAAEKALALDDLLPEAHQAMGFVFAALEARFSDAEREIRRAYTLAPNDSSVVSHLSRYLSLRGDFDEATRLSNQAIELDPLNPTAHMIRGAVFAFAGRLEESEKAYLKTLDLSPEMTGVRAIYSSVLLRQGRIQEALEMAEKEKLTGYRACALAIIYHAVGRPADSERALATLIGEGEQWGIQIAHVYGYRGEVDKAFEWLERSYELRDSGIPITKVAVFLKSLHSDPRWPVFLKKIGLGD